MVELSNEKERTKYRALGDTVGLWVSGRVTVVDGSELVVVGEV